VDPKDDPEARIRELERSLSDAAGKSELTAAERGGGYDKYSASPTARTTAGFRGSKTGTVGGPDLMWTQNKDLLSATSRDRISTPCISFGRTFKAGASRG